MIPVRVPAGSEPHVISDFVRTLDSEHPLYHYLCPACDEPIGGLPVTLVCVGIAPHKRKDVGWTRGGAVAVHAACAGLEPGNCGEENAL